ncbi:cysteine hydrolase family protein [Parazoarcus communis]|uniref:Cysteine hydrolase n=1 Tax=Parazoarcus communis SWub3 = DSM 12120 TaxID=1121029 RepID=A0A323V3J5_9RHOO|nr:cysteine hydrolase [Parazoarcus communis]NMG72699.1 isochorismatase family protein [Parazoarcus communis SWub3 = DSM 12120]PZA14718.1 cysteine hydrolase [Azoarcus communis] [Parazoarcus communis SWub3 = DSM 12120]
MNPLPIVLALHYQNDQLHPKGRIRVGLSEDDPARARLIAAAGRLLTGARARGWPIIHVRMAFRPDYADLTRNTPIFRKTIEIGAVRDGHWGAEFYAELAPIDSPREFAFKHNRISAFYGTELEILLRQLDARQLVVGGIATHSVVESTVRDAADRGYEVTVAADACAAAGAAHDNALASMRLIAEVDDVDPLLARLDAQGAQS